MATNAIVLILTLAAGVLSSGREGAVCMGNDNTQCEAPLTCNNGHCGPPYGGWPDHCIDDLCYGDGNNCGGALVCSPETNLCVAPENWEGHGIGTTCNSNDDCTDDLICHGGHCYVDWTCTWPGHCIGVPCSDENDCAGELVCSAPGGGVCVVPATAVVEHSGTEGAACSGNAECDGNLKCTMGKCVPPCDWEGHCLGFNPCTTHDDCGSQLVCSPNGQCVTPCNWPGHCLGASCNGDDECTDDLVCRGKRCILEHDCAWEGHCYGAPCNNDDKCAGELVCVAGKCTQTGLALKRMKIRELNN